MAVATAVAQAARMSRPRRPVQIPARPFTTAEAMAIGLTWRDLSAAVARGSVRRVVRGLFVPPGSADDWESRARAVALVVGSEHVVIDRTAAWIHGVNTLTLLESSTPPPVEVAAAPSAHATERGDVIGRNRDLAEHDVMTVGGLRVTTPLRTALDLARHLHRREAHACLNEFARLHGIRSEDLAAEVPRFKGRRGVVQLKSLIGLIDPAVESQRESWTLLALADARVPLPQAQVWVEVDGVPTYRLDFAWPLHKVAVEYDGVAAHLMTEEQRLHDRERRRVLRELGWRVVVVRNGDFTGRRLDRWIGEVRAALNAQTYSPLRWKPRR